MTGTWNDPNFETQSGVVYKTNLDNCLAVAERTCKNFAPHEQATPNMTVRVDEGYIYNSGTRAFTDKAAQNSATIVKPSVNNRIDRVVIDLATGVISVVTGSENPSPSAPAIPSGKGPCCQVLLTPSTTAITNSMITDERAGIVSSVGADHGCSGPLTGSGNWTCPANVTTIYVTAVAGGGGAGGTSATGTDALNASAGGNAGAALFKKPYTVVPGTTYPYVVGIGGYGGAAGLNNGNQGGNTYLGSAGAIFSLTGGLGGGHSGGLTLTALLAMGGHGGSNVLGTGGVPGWVTAAGSAKGTLGQGYGAGAGGSAVWDSVGGGTSIEGAHGSNGILIIEW